MSRPAGNAAQPRLASRPPRTDADELIAARPACAPLVEALAASIAASLRDGTSCVHVEAGPTGLSLRVRRDGELATRRLGVDPVPGPSGAADGPGALQMMDAWLDALPGGAGQRPGGEHLRSSFLWNVAGETAHVTLELLRGHVGASAVLELRRHDPAPPALDALFEHPAATARLREALHESSGLIVVVADDRAVLGKVSDAVVQCVTGPHRKIVQVRLHAGDALAGAVQLSPGTGCAAAGPAPVENGSPHADRRYAAALLGQDPDVLVLDDALSPRDTVPAALALAPRAAVVRCVAAGSIAAALSRLVAEGMEARWLAAHLRSVATVGRVRRLCLRCRRAVRPPEGETGIAAVVTSIHRHYEAPGCARCHGTGVERTELVLDVLGATPVVREALQEGRIETAAAGLHASGRCARRVQSLVRDGLVGLEEGLRFG